MGKVRGSVVLNLVNNNGNDDEGAKVESEQRSEEEEPNEQELSEEEPNEEENSFWPTKHEPSEEEPIEEVTAEEPSEEQSEEDRPEGSIAQPFSNSDEIEENQLNTAPSNLEKRRLADALLVHARKRWKEDQDSKPESYSDSFSTCILDKRKVMNNGNTMMEEEENTGSSGKRRRSQGETQLGNDEVTVDVGDAARKKRKTRWASDDAQLKMLGPLKLPDFANGLAAESFPDPEMQKLYAQLLGINQKLKAQVPVDNRLKIERSPSPPPVYSNLGIQINTREARLRAELVKRKQKIISKLIAKNPTFKPPSDYKPPKLYRKLYIPVKQYPGYNFVGLILGPRGHTQKRMEKETGAKILLRGKGSNREGKSLQHKDAKPDPSENEDLHVYIEAGTQKSLDAAVEMVEKLLVPVEEGLNEHKRAQLRELAKLNEKLKGENSTGFQKATSETNASSDACGSASHVTAACPLVAPTPGTGMNDSRISCLTEFGGSAISPCSGVQIPSSTAPWIASPASNALSTGEGKPLKEIDEANLFVGFLPQSVDVDKLRELFAPFGPISEAKVIKDKTTGRSKGYGFITFTDRIFAAEAVAWMNRYKIDGKMLAVRVAGLPPSTVSTNMGPPNFTYLPPYQWPAAIAQGNPTEMDWPMLPERHASFPRNSCFISHN